MRAEETFGTRIPREDELPVISRIYRRSMTDLLQRHNTGEETIGKVIFDIRPWELAFWLEQAGKETGFLRVAEIRDTGEIAGFIYGEIRDSGLCLGWISAHFVLPEYQLRGIGTRLLDECREFFFRQGVKKLAALTTHAINPVSQSLYSGKGDMSTRINLINFDLEGLAVPPRYGTAGCVEIGVDEVCAMDRENVGYDRGRALRALFRHENAAAIRVNKGYAIVVPGKHIGPLGATSAKEMLELIFLSRMLGGAVIRLPENYPQAITRVTSEVFRNGGRMIDSIHLMSRGQYRFPRFYAPYHMHG